LAQRVFPHTKNKTRKRNAGVDREAEKGKQNVKSGYRKSRAPRFQ